MSEFKSALKPYDLEEALATDRGDDCLILDICGDENSRPVPSLKHIVDKVDDYNTRLDNPVFSATKLYIIGEWKLTPEVKDETESKEEDSKADADTTMKFSEVTNKIRTLIEQMRKLKELTWVSELPFTAEVWASLPTTLVKLVLDLGEPVRLDQDGDVLHKSYITSTELKPLQEQTELKELRLFRVRDSIQPLIWETVFRNTTEGGMRVMDIQMANAPIVRSEQWKWAKNVVGLTVPTETSEEKEYKGMDGKGILHYSIGTGEYLDGLCIRKARIASGLDEATPLPLWCLKLDGFVIDHLPFEHELSQIVLLTCGENCVDSGLRAPKSRQTPHNKWSRAINNATSHCLIQWPNWTGIFDEQGDQRNKLGIVVPQELGLSISADELSFSPIVPLTEELLNLKELNDALATDKESDYFTVLPLHASSLVTQTPMGAISNIAIRGSEVPTPTIASSTTVHSPTFSTVDGSAITPFTSFDSDIPTVDLETVEQIDAPASDTASNIATTGSNATTSGENDTPDKSTFSHKSRPSLSMLSGPVF